MKLIKDIGIRRAKDGKTYRWGIFYCSYCKEEVKKPYHNGLKNKSCGCAQRKLNSESHITHGCAHTGRVIRLYSVWVSMKNRCYNPKATGYKDYGGRGIKVYKQWKKSYVMFEAWAIMYGYEDNLTIDRINNDGNYTPSNCQWTTRKEQAYNRRTNKLTIKKARQIRSLYFNVRISQVLLGRIFGVSSPIIWKIVHSKTWV